jgi:hypothetical protein
MKHASHFQSFACPPILLLGWSQHLGQPGIIAIGLLLLLGAAHTQADVVTISSIKDIVNGTTIDFEQPGSTANDILPIFDMIATPNVGITTFTSAVTGNNDAPISDRALFGDLRIQTTGKPWNEIGLTGVGNQLGVIRTLTLTAFDINNIELGSVTREFAPVDSSFEAYNAAAVFLGLSSTTPIFAIELSSDNPNVGWDNLRFTVAPPFAGTPGEPNCHGESVSALAQQFGDLDTAAAALGFPSVQALQDAIRAFCEG